MKIPTTYNPKNMQTIFNEEAHSTTSIQHCRQQIIQCNQYRLWSHMGPENVPYRKKKTEKSILANPLEIADNSKNVSLKIMSRGLFGIGLFCTFPHQKNIFQGSKVVSEAIFSFLAPEVPSMNVKKRQKRALSQKAFCSRF